MPIPFFDNIEMNSNRVRNASDGVLAKDYVTLSQLQAATTSQGFAATIGNGVATTYNVVHGLNSTDVLVQVQELSSGDTVNVNMSTNGVNSVDVTFSVAPAANSFRVLIYKVA